MTTIAIEGFKQPMFAPRENPLIYPLYFQKLQFPLLVSPKVDGIRCVVKRVETFDFDADFKPISLGTQNTCMSRTLIKLPSAQVQSLFSHFLDCDGELIEGDETDFNVCNRTQSFVMSDEKHSDSLSFRVFDCAAVDLCRSDFEVRLEYVQGLIDNYSILFPDSNVSLIQHDWCDTLEELLAIEERYLSLGYEGVMMRSPFGPYKHGRGTFKEGYIYKLKRFKDDEAVLVGIETGKTNLNPDIRSNFGTAKRQTLKANMIESDLAGTLMGSFKGLTIEVAPGTLSHDERKHMLACPEEYIGRSFTFRHFPHGAKDLPRQARFANWRSKIDI